MQEKEEKPKIEIEDKKGPEEQTEIQTKGFFAKAKDAIFGKEGETEEEKGERQKKVAGGLATFAKIAITGIAFLVNPMLGIVVAAGMGYNEYQNSQKETEKEKEKEKSDSKPKEKDKDGKDKEKEKEKDKDGKETEQEKDKDKSKGVVGFLKDHPIAAAIGVAVLLFSGLGIIGAVVAFGGAILAGKAGEKINEKVQENGGWGQTISEGLSKVKNTVAGMFASNEKDKPIEIEMQDLSIKSGKNNTLEQDPKNLNIGKGVEIEMQDMSGRKSVLEQASGLLKNATDQNKEHTDAKGKSEVVEQSKVQDLGGRG